MSDTLSAAVVRECKRELDVDVAVGELLGAFEDTHLGLPIITLVYACRIVAGEPRAADIVDDARWFALDALPGIAYPSIARALALLRRRTSAFA